MDMYYAGLWNDSDLSTDTHVLVTTGNTWDNFLHTDNINIHYAADVCVSMKCDTLLKLKHLLTLL